MQNKKLLILSVILLFAMIFSLFSLYAYGNSNPSLSARSAVLYEPSSKEIIYSKNENQQLPMASTTKIMTALIAIEALPLDEIIRVPNDAVGIEGSSIYLKSDDELTVRDLIYAVMLQSANDAAATLAYAISGDIASFSALMNRRAAEMGATSTSFENPHGLDSENHYTTAKDLAIIASYALENDTFRKICSTYKYSFNISDQTRTVVNHNKLLKLYDGSIGVKTGYTKRCGRCLVGAAERNGVRLISVTLDAPDDWNDHSTLLNLGFSLYESIDPSLIMNNDFNIPVISGTKVSVLAKTDTHGINLVVKKNSSEIKTRVQLKKYAVAPVENGEQLGTVEYIIGDKTVATAPIIANESISYSNKKGRLRNPLFQ